jgi:hypothetical protein
LRSGSDGAALGGKGFGDAGSGGEGDSERSWVIFGGFQREFVFKPSASRSYPNFEILKAILIFGIFACESSAPLRW